MKQIALGLACASLFIGLIRGAAGQGAPPTAVSYSAALKIVQSALMSQSTLLAHAAGATPDTVPIATLAASALKPYTVVASADGEIKPVNNLGLERTIQRVASLGNAPDRAAAYAQVAAQIGSLRGDVTGRNTPIAPKTAQAAVRAVLGRTEFDSDPLPPPSLLDRFLAWLDRLLSRHHTPAGPESSISPAFIKTVLIVVAAGAFALLVAVLVQYLRRRAQSQDPLALTEEEEALVEARDAVSLRALAEEQSRQGEWRRAFRLTYLASLVTLDTQGTLRFDRSKTNWEYLRALRAAGQGETSAALQPFTREFDRIWYGGAQAGPADYAYAVAQYQSLTQVSAPVLAS